MAVCPVYSVVRQEGGVARGKLVLVQARDEGKQALSRRYRDLVTACLLCGSCTQSCPNQVDTASVVRAAREELVAEKKSGWLKHLVLGRILSCRRTLPVLLKGARASRVLWASRVPKDSGLHLRLLRGPGGQRRKVPELARPFFLERKLPESPVGSGLRVSLFVGCVSNYLRPQAAESAVRILRNAGASVVVAQDQGCCGLPAFGAGEREAARKLAVRNLEALMPLEGPGPDAITTPCASCAVMLKKNLLELLKGDSALERRARMLSERVVPFSRLWVRLESGVKQRIQSASDNRPLLTYHDPCHLSRGFSEKDAPRHLLASLPGARFVEMAHPCKCCGHGGSFNVSHYDLSMAISRSKVESVLASGADILVTECSGCLLQLSEAIGRRRAGFEVITTAEAADRFSGGRHSDETQGMEN